MPIFNSKYDFTRFIKTLCYYQNDCLPLKFSKFISLSLEEKALVDEQLRLKKDFLVEIIAYCLMPTHFHLLVKQIKENGIHNFVRKISDSYAHYFNIKLQRRGGIFECRFKATRVETDEQLLHVSRYIHLNPYSSFLIKDLHRLLTYPFSSLGEYLGLSKNNICQKEIVLGQFKNTGKYEEFVLDQANYQRSLDVIKHHALE